MSQEESSYSEKTELPIQIQNVLLRALKSSQSLLEQTVVEKIRVKIENITTGDSIIHYIDNFLFSLINKIQQLSQAVTLDINKDDYEILQTAVQKSEQQIRHHIRLEQQLKIYMEGLEERIEELQKELECERNKYFQLFQSAKSLDNEKKELKKKIKALEFKYKPNYDRGQKEHYMSHKGSKLLTEPSMHQDSYTSAYKMYQDRNKITRTRNFSNKSGENNKKLNISNSKKKDIEENINVSLGQSPKKKKSYQEPSSSKEIEPSLTKTVLLKEVQRKRSKKLMNNGVQIGMRKDRKQIRSNSVCN